jgi:hypothetical protein
MAERPTRWRPWLRALHRDVGYLAVGLTIIYALSGLAVNHVADWDPSFVSYERERHVPLPLPVEDQAAARAVLAALDVPGPAREVYRASPTQLEIGLDKRALHVDTQSGRVIDEGQRPRFFLRVANWLHLNRGKRGWRYFADGYALFLLFLATSGLFMLPGKRGLRGRGSVLAAVGILLPVVYLRVAGGPDHATHTAALAPAASDALTPAPATAAPPPLSSARGARRRAHRR